MLSLALPSPLDAELFKTVTTTQDVDRVILLMDQGARLDVPFNLDYELLRETTTTFTLTSLEALMVGWDLPAISRVLNHWGPLPDVVLPNIASALHTVNYVKTDACRSSIEKYTRQEINLLWNISAMSRAIDNWSTTFFAPTIWECIVCKNLVNPKIDELSNIVQALGNVPLVSNESTLSRILGVAKNHDTYGVLLCTKFGVNPQLHHHDIYQQLHQRALANPLDPLITKIMLEHEVGDLGRKIIRKI